MAVYFFQRESVVSSRRKLHCHVFFLCAIAVRRWAYQSIRNNAQHVRIRSSKIIFPFFISEEDKILYLCYSLLS